MDNLRWDWSRMDKYKKCINYLEASFYNEEGECSKGYSKKMCKDVHTCYYKQLLAEQAKNSELDATFKILKINHKLTISELNNEKAKNKKLVEVLERIENCWNNIDSDKFAGHGLYITLQQALNEVNKC